MTQTSIEHALTAALLAAMAAMTIAILAPSAAQAAEPAGASLRVKYADLDLETDAGVATLYSRLAGAALRVCDDGGSRGLRHEQAVRACRASALARAVGDIGSAKLAALGAGRKPLG